LASGDKEFGRRVPPPSHCLGHRPSSLDPVHLCKLVIVALPAHRITQHLVGLLDRPKRRAVPLIAVWMQAFHFTPIGQFDLILGGILIDIKDLVIALVHHSVPAAAV
jgi:hypothetical protein